jgi:hypothetical protein
VSTIRTEHFEAFRAIGVPENKAILAAIALSRSPGLTQPVAADIRPIEAELYSINALVRPIDVEVRQLMTELRLMKWMTVVVLALEAAIFVRLFQR